MPDAPLDCLIIGAGPAGMTAALYLVRFRRRVRLLDSGASRALLIPATHNQAPFAGGISGPDLLTRMREHLLSYQLTVEHVTVESLERRPHGFTALAGGQEIQARTVLLATGCVDIEPPLPGLVDAIRHGIIRHCPICDGYEVSGQSIGVIGFGRGGKREAEFLRGFSDDVTLLTLGQPLGLGTAERHALHNAGIQVETDPVEQVLRQDHGIAALTLKDGRRLSFDTLYSALGAHIRSDLARGLGAHHDGRGGLHVDHHQQTSVPGLYAAGDVVTGLHQIAVAYGQAAVAATAVHNRLAGR